MLLKHFHFPEAWKVLQDVLILQLFQKIFKIQLLILHKVLKKKEIQENLIYTEKFIQDMTK